MDPAAPTALVLRGEGNSPVPEQSLSAALASHWGTGYWGRTTILGSRSAGRFSSGGDEFLRLVTLLAALGVRWFAKSLNNLIIAPALISNFSSCIKDSDG